MIETIQMEGWLYLMRRGSQRNAAGFAKQRSGPKTVVTNANGLEGFKRLMAPGFFEGVMRRFLDNELVGPEGALYEMFHRYAANPTDYLPRLAKPSPLSNDSAAMFPLLWSVLKETAVWSGPDKVYGGVGPLAELMALQLSPFMPILGERPTTSPLNSLFLAVEYGTGIAENVGGAQWVRHSGSTKDKSGTGAWWWWPGGKGVHGVEYVGQKGLHFLDDARSRQPLAIYAFRLQNAFPALVQESLYGR
jgi:hypothetical protein